MSSTNLKEENMNSRRRIMKSFVFVGLVFVFALSLVSQSGAQNKHLKGEYAVVGQATCLTHWLVNPSNPGDPSATTYFVHTASAQGTVTFNGDGTGSGRIYSVDITLPTYTPIPLGSFWSDPRKAWNTWAIRARTLSNSSLLILSHQMERSLGQ